MESPATSVKALIVSNNKAIRFLPSRFALLLIFDSMCKLGSRLGFWGFLLGYIEFQVSSGFC